MLLTRAFHEDRGEYRHKVLTPDTAHGTNPATVTMAGYEVVKVGTDANGNVDLDDLRAKATDDVACLMLTNPSTVGLFEPGIEEIAAIVHGVGATLYYDGANLNAIMGITRPGDMGFDIVHFNLHKSFTQPHGGGGPGAGPIAVSARIEPFLPRPQVVRRDGAGNGASHPFYDLDYERPKSIGRLRGFQGNYGVFVRSYAYIRSLGAPGLREVSEVAVLNANYLLAKLREVGVAEYLPAAFDRLCMHEFVLSGAPMKRELKIKTLDLAKRLLDHGVHPPTVYFPLIVDEALLIEPTETETKETLDHFAEIVADDAARGQGRPRGRAQRPVHDAGPAARRGRRRAQAGGKAGHVGRGACTPSPAGACTGRTGVACDPRELRQTDTAQEFDLVRHDDGRPVSVERLEVVVRVAVELTLRCPGGVLLGRLEVDRDVALPGPDPHRARHALGPRQWTVEGDRREHARRDLVAPR